MVGCSGGREGYSVRRSGSSAGVAIWTFLWAAGGYQAMVLMRPMRTMRARVSERRIAQVSVERRRVDAMRCAPVKKMESAQDESVELLNYLDFEEVKRMELATTTAGGHEVQRRELTGDHHVSCSL